MHKLAVAYYLAPSKGSCKSQARGRLDPGIVSTLVDPQGLDLASRIQPMVEKPRLAEKEAVEGKKKLSGATPGAERRAETTQVSGAWCQKRVPPGPSFFAAFSVIGR
ncbi:hypothetical protein FALCPG4_000804 [Fusarium falciforme]